MPQMFEEGERNLIESAKKGDKEAFGGLYEMHLKRIYRFLFFQLKDEQTAEDLTEQTFIKAWDKIYRFRIKKGGSFRAWLFKIARNLALDYFRKKPTISLSEIPEPKSFDNTEEKIYLDEKSKELRQAIDKLPSVLRQAVILRYLEELPYEQVAQALGKRKGTVRVMVFRALKILRKELEE